MGLLPTQCAKSVTYKCEIFCMLRDLVWLPACTTWKQQLFFLRQNGDRSSTWAKAYRSSPTGSTWRACSEDWRQIVNCFTVSSVTWDGGVESFKRKRKGMLAAYKDALRSEIERMARLCERYILTCAGVERLKHSCTNESLYDTWQMICTCLRLVK